MKKMKVKVPVLGVVVMALVAVLAIGLTVNANISLKQMIANVAGTIVGNDISQQLNVEGDESFGGVVNDPCTTTNGNSVCIVKGTFIDASTTIVSITNPFLMSTTSASDVVIKGAWPNAWTGASSTVDILRLNVTGVATSSFTVSCGAAATAYSTASIALVSSGTVGTSTKAYIENNVTAAQGASTDGGTVAKIAIGPLYPYLVCKVTVTGAGLGTSEGSFTEVTNTFDGTFVARISKNQ